MKALARAEILQLIPHAGAICLLDEILDWDAGFLHARSRRFASPDNPLRREDGSLGLAAGIEIAGQAMAAHGRLTAESGAAPRPGMLVGLRDVRLGAGPLTGAMLAIEVRLRMGDSGGAAYGFSVSGEAGEILSGRAMVRFGAPA